MAKDLLGSSSSSSSRSVRDDDDDDTTTTKAWFLSPNPTFNYVIIIHSAGLRAVNYLNSVISLWLTKINQNTESL